MRQYMETGDESKINIIGKKNPIITDELNEKRDEIYLKYASFSSRIFIKNQINFKKSKYATR
mgnify:FL=1